MPIYIYQCPYCGHCTERMRTIAERDDPEGCPACDFPLKRILVATPAIHYKAKGFTGAGRRGDGRIDPMRHRDGSPLTEEDLNRTPQHLEDE